MKKIIKDACEVCGNNDVAALHLHHIIERTELNTSNHPMNLAILCANCHSLVHAKQIKIIGLFPSTRPPNGRTLVFEKEGNKNLDIENKRIQLSPSWKLHGSY